MPGGCLGAVNAGTKLDCVQVNFQQATLGDKQLERNSDHRLQALAEPPASGPQIKVARQLLADGACAPQGLSAAVRFHCVANLFYIKAVVMGKRLVLRSEERRVGKESRYRPSEVHYKKR